MATARGQITIVDLNDGRSINLYLSSNKATTQIYDDAVADKFTPNYASDNLVVTPEVYVSGADGDQIARCSNVVWKINGSTDIAQWGTAAAIAPFALTINKNMIDVSQLLVECTLSYNDPDTSLATTAKASMTFTKVNNAGNSICAVIYAPDGTTISKNASQAINQVRLHCDMWRGSTIDDTDVAYNWQKMASDGTWQSIASMTTEAQRNYSGWTTNELTVKADGVDNFELFKCIITDTDTGASTYNKTCEQTITVNDATDPYTVDIASPTGTVLTKGSNSTTLTANIWQSGEMLSAAAHNAARYEWIQYDKNGENAKSVGNTRSITIVQGQISVRATFVCTVTI